MPRLIPPWLAAGTLLLAGPAAFGATPPLPLPFHEVFDRGRLPAAWRVDASVGNTIGMTNGALQIGAAANTYAHVQRPLGVDNVQAACTLKPRGGISWVSSLFLYWDPRNWCQVSVLESGPDYYAVELINGHLVEHRVPAAATAPWYHLAIELAEDGVRFQTSADGQTWASWLVLTRPPPWRGRPPALLVLGKGFNRDEAGERYTGADLNNDYTERGPPAVSLFRDVSVRATPATAQRLTPAERHAQADAGRDWLGEEELAAPDDPSFGSVSRHFPPMKRPREILGVKDGPQEFAVLPDGWLDLGGTHAGFVIGRPGTPFGQGNCLKALEEGSLPMVIATHQHAGLTFEETVFGWSPDLSPDTPLSAFIRLRLRNPDARARAIPLEFDAPTATTNWVVQVPANGAAALCLQVPFDHPAAARPIAPRGVRRAGGGDRSLVAVLPGARHPTPGPGGAGESGLARLAGLQLHQRGQTRRGL